MCILCVASRWSRRIVTMLPWLVIPLIILWALSQLLPPGFRFEVTSPRLACVAVLLVSLGWYELAMPRLSAWRARRRALLRERRRIEAQEVAKWRKEATRRCRNCFTAYKDQTPGGGRFMCTYCGHVSKRPVLDIPGGARSAGSSFSLTGAATGFINGGGIFAARSSKIWNGRGSQDRPTLGGGRGWMGGRPWTDGGSWGVNGSWFGGTWPGSALYFGTAGAGLAGAGTFIGGGIFGGERCSAGESYFGVFWFLLRVLSHLLFCVGWIWRKLWRAGYSGEDGMDGSHRACHSRGEDVGPSPETRGEKARRKAEEKRLARLEKDQLEAEERKQREEVARLVEERRRQRDEKLEAEKEREREAAAERERDIRREREAERRRQEKAREKEKVQAKEKPKDQDSEELKRKKGKENEKKTDTEKNEGEDLKAASINASDGKTSKPTKLDTSLKGYEAGVKVAGNHSSEWGSSKYLGSAKSGFFSQSKNVAASINSATSFWGRSFATGSNSAGKSSKAAIPGTSSFPSASNPSTGSIEKCSEVSGSAWNRIHWANVWGKAASKIPDVASKKLEVVESTDKKADPVVNDGVQDLIDGSIVSSSTGGVSQQPIAPPSSLSDSWDNLFSGPLCFPPVELPVDSVYQEQRQTKAGSKIHQVPFASSSSSLLSPQSYFEASASMVQPCTQVAMSCTCSDAVNPATFSSLPPSVSSSLNMIDFAGADIHNPLCLLDPFSDSFMPSLANDLGTSLNPLLPSGVSGTAIAPLPKDSELISANQDELLQILEPWNMPPMSIDGAQDNLTEGMWHHWVAPQPRQVSFLQPSPWDAPFQQGNDPLQPFPPTLAQLNFKPESQLPSSLFPSEHKDGSFMPTYGESSCSIPMLGSNNWLDSSAMESIMHVWEDADINQRVPPEFVDCITYSLMQDPVITADGHSYERSAIEEWLKSHDTSPKTGEVLPPPPGGNGTGVDKTLRPNHILRGQIIEYGERLARRFGSHEGSFSGWNTTAAGVSRSSWSAKESTMRPPIRGFYPTPGVESVWSYNVSGG